MNPYRPRGFSLIELVVSMAIIAIIAGVASVRFARSAEAARVDAAARRVVSTLDDARTRARTRGGACKVTFNVDEGTMQFKWFESSAAELDLINLRSDPYRVRMKFSNPDGSTEVEYNHFGRPVSVGTISVYSGEFVRVISVDPETGHASIQ